MAWPWSSHIFRVSRRSKRIRTLEWGYLLMRYHRVCGRWRCRSVMALTRTHYCLFSRLLLEGFDACLIMHHVLTSCSCAPGTFLSCGAMTARHCIVTLSLYVAYSFALGRTLLSGPVLWLASEESGYGFSRYLQLPANWRV